MINLIVSCRKTVKRLCKSMQNAETFKKYIKFYFNVDGRYAKIIFFSFQTYISVRGLYWWFFLKEKEVFSNTRLRTYWQVKLTAGYNNFTWLNLAKVSRKKQSESEKQVWIFFIKSSLRNYLNLFYSNINIWRN